MADKMISSEVWSPKMHFQVFPSFLNFPLAHVDFNIDA